MGSTKRNEDRMNTKASVNQTRLELSSIWHHFQSTLFPWLQETLTVLAQKQMQLIEVLEMAKLETHLPYLGGYRRGCHREYRIKFKRNT